LHKFQGEWYSRIQNLHPRKLLANEIVILPLCPPFFVNFFVKERNFKRNCLKQEKSIFTEATHNVNEKERKVN